MYHALANRQDSLPTSVQNPASALEDLLFLAAGVATAAMAYAN
jgi:hypothetical protein